ncbi:hypothetical protein ACFX13_031476 [Malus domestica]
MSTILCSQPSTSPPPPLIGGIPLPPLPAGEAPSPPPLAGGIPSPPPSTLEEEKEMGILALPLEVEPRNTIGHQNLTYKPHSRKINIPKPIIYGNMVKHHTHQNKVEIIYGSIRTHQV